MSAYSAFAASIFHAQCVLHGYAQELFIFINIARSISI
ncbi:hypothetical protein BN132_15 [Cronobacter turicensis 564]|nr:hypothetical protein BN132_15 [Cronobacter turicensis 564]